MASISCHSISVPPTPKPQPNPAQLRRHCVSKLHRPDSLSRSVLNLRSSVVRAANSAASSSTSRGTEQQKQEKPRVSEEEAITVDVLRRFFDLNSGKWNGSFFQFDSAGKMLHKLDTKLAVSSYGEDDLISLIQTLYIKQPSSRTSISGHVDIEPEWAEYKIKETNMFTVDKYQQIGFFPDERAFALRYQTAGMLETVLRQGVLGEDDIGEESPRNLKLPSRRPSIVCESVVYSFEKDMRVRAFHIMDPKGVLEMLLIFLEERGQGLTSHPSLGHSSDDTNRVSPFLGKWKGHSITKRSGVYGATIAEADTMVSLEMDDKGQLIQDVALTASGRDVTSNVHWTGIMLNNQVIFEGGYQVVLLPGGMYMGCPCDIGKSVAETEPFHLEFCWVESPEKRQRLVRTYDVEGMAVSTTYFYETKV